MPLSPSADASSHSIARRDALKLPLSLWLASLGGAASAAASPASRSITLNGTWNLTYGELAEGEPPAATQPPADWPTIPAAVPGNVELDLVAAGRLEAPERGNRIYELRKLEDYQWWYRRDFPTPDLQPGEKAELVFDGLDCLGTVWVNGTLVGRPENMLIPHRFDVSALLRPHGVNQVVVRIDPATPAGSHAARTAKQRANEGALEGLSIRKAPHMFGWDIMPRAVSAGLWRDVRLELVRPTRWASVYWNTRSVDRAKHTATIGVAWDFVTRSNQVDGFRVQAVLRRNGKVVHSEELPVLTTSGRERLVIENPDLWWPRGYGEPALYEATLTLSDAAGHVLDEHHSRIGIRTLKLNRTDISTPAAPGEFCFVVNGEPIFIKGTNWSPLDALHSRDRDHLERVFPLLVELNCNMLRAWGGGVYESDRLFDLCDESGILVWQDFAMACGLYPQTDEFAKAIATEAEAVITRLRNHPSLALWSGNNECDESYFNLGMDNPDPNLDRISREVLPRAVSSFDPYRPYLPSSPYYSSAVVAAGGNTKLMPEVHLWGPRGYFKAPFYTESPANFVSEIGYHGCPSRSSLERMFDPQFVEPWVKGREWNDQWLTKSVRRLPRSPYNANRNDLMLKQIQAFFGAVPETLDDFILASQITQAEAMKFFIELWRQQKGRRRGMIWWNLRDGWPIISDAVVDYYLDKKLAFHYIRRVQRDVQAICCEEQAGQHGVVVVNDTLKPVRGKLRVARLGQTAPILDLNFSVPSNGLAKVGSIPHPKTTEMWTLAWQLDGGSSFRNHYLATSTTVPFGTYRGWMKDIGLELG
jgi:beta-mannosidase